MGVTASRPPRRGGAFVPALGLVLGLVAAAVGGDARAGAFIFSGETNGVDVVTHPTGYTGTGGTLAVSVCVDPTSANAAQMEISVRNAVNTWNAQQAITGNLLFGGANDIPASAVDFESTAVHEIGHCIGLAHPNLATESGLGEPDRNYTKSTTGFPATYDLDDGADNVIGSSDDLRGNDVNLHWFQIGVNSPFAMAGTVDSSTYSRDLADLPGAHSYAANGDRGVAALLGVPNTEAVMQQGAFGDEDQRRLTHDDVATLRYAESGLDESDASSDDYTLVLSYAGLTASCDVVLDFDNGESSFAVCQTGGQFIGATDHVRITSADIFFNTGFNWYFNDDLTFCGNGALDGLEECDDGNTDPGDCCSASCEFESAGSGCEAGDACLSGDTCDGAGSCSEGATPLVCDDGLFCNGTETCDSGSGCLPGTPPVCDDAVACTLDFCNTQTQACDAMPDDAQCADAFFCNGAEVCDPVLDCQPGSDPCAPFACDENLDVCGCNTAVDCDDALFCNGAEACTGGFCALGTAVDCDDSTACTIDSCNESTDQCDNVPDDGPCDDGQFCNGTETCNVSAGCVPGSPVVCNDLVSCTLDSCNETSDACDFVPDPVPCGDGLFCTGAEICDPVLDCQPGFDPCPGQVCDEGGGTCQDPDPVTFGEQQTGTSSGSSSVSTSGSVSAVADDLYLAAISTRPVEAVTGVTGLGLTWSPVGSQCSSGSETRVDVWSAQGSPTGATVVTASLAGAPDNAVIAVGRYGDVALPEGVGNVTEGNTNGIGGACTGGSGTNNYFFNAATTVSNSVFWGAVAKRNKSHTQGSGYTERAEEQSGNGNSAAGIAVQDRVVTAPASISIDGSFNGPVDWGFVGVEIRSRVSECVTAFDCDDGLFCNGPEDCAFGTCVPGAPPTCNDLDECTTDSCVEGPGCVNDPNAACAPAVPAIPQWGPWLLGALLAAAGTWLGRRRRALLGAVVAAGLASAPTTAGAGSFVFAGEANGIDLVTHPSGYTGSGGTLAVSICVDPASPNAAEMEDAVQRVVATWNARAPVTGNLLLGASNDIPSGAIDFESTALHEVGHCIGLAHPNLASESGLNEPERNYTRSTDGADNGYDLDAGPDAAIGSGDDLRDDDANLHWYQIGANNPFAIAGTVDSTTYRRALTGLPAGHTFAANGDRGVGVLLGAPNTEAVMQQGAFFDEDQRRLTHDDAATIRYGMSGLDEIAGTADDYDLVLSYTGLTAACDVVLAFDDSETGFAVCQVSGSFLGSDHARITSANIFFNTGFSWFFGGAGPVCGNGTLESGEACDDGNTSSGDCCSASCSFESQGSACDDNDACTSADTCDGTGACQAGAPLVCDDGLFCNGSETCSPASGCISGSDPCGGGACDEAADLCPGSGGQVRYEQVETGSATSQSTVATDTALQAAAGNLYLASIATRPPTAVQAVSGLGLQWSELRAQCAGRNQTALSVWMAYGSPTGATAVDAQLESSVSATVITATRYSGVDPDLPVGAVASANTNGTSGGCSGGSDNTSYSILLPISAPGAVAYGTAAMRNKRHSPGSDYVERVETKAGSGGNMASAAVEDRELTSPGTTAVDGTFHRNVDWAAIAVEVLPPSGPCTDDSHCSDGVFCNGAEMCVAGACLVGAPIDCDDGVSCTLDACDELADACTNAQDHAVCNDALFCNGVETCDALLDCQPGADPCPGTTCDEGTGTCGCTNDSECADGLFCNGTESCNGGTCAAGSPVACDDGVDCTIDTCSESQAACTHAPSDASCADGQFCNGAETCDAQAGCQPGADPCAGTPCDELSDVCEGGGSGSALLEEVASGGATSSSSVATDAALAAVAGDLYLAAVSMRKDAQVTGVSGLGLVWSEVRDQCAGRGQTGLSVWAAQGAPTGAGPVTASFSSSLDASTIIAARYSGAHASTPLGSVVSGNTNGEDGACSGGSDDAAYAFALPVSGTGSAVFGAASMRNKRHEPGATFAEHAEVAAGSGGGVASTAVQDQLSAGPGTIVLDGTFSSNVDWAVVGIEIVAGSGGPPPPPPPPGCASDPECSDGLFCNGDEACEAGACVAGTPPSCDDGVSCTADACNEATDGCDTIPNDAACDDSLFCNGVETCSALLGCQPGGDPCAGLACDEAADSCAGGSGDVQFEEVQTGGAVGAEVVQTQASLSAAAGDLYLASISFRRDAAVVDVQGLGLAWTPLRTQCGARNQTGIAVWWAQGTPSGSGPVSATFGSAPLSSTISVVRYSGVNPASPIGDVAAANTNGPDGTCSGGTDTAAYALSLTASSAGGVAFGTASMRNRRHSPGASYTERSEIAAGSGGDVSSTAVEDRAVSAPATVQVDGTFHRDVDWAVIAVEVRP